MCEQVYQVNILSLRKCFTQALGSTRRRHKLCRIDAAVLHQQRFEDTWLWVVVFCFFFKLRVSVVLLGTISHFDTLSVVWGV